MNEINVKIELVTLVSKKTGNEYQKLIIKFANGYEKDYYFSDKAEQFAILQNFKK